MADKKELALTSHLTPEVGAIYADEGKFKQVLYNLLSNAVKFTPEGGRIDITARRRRASSRSWSRTLALASRRRTRSASSRPSSSSRARRRAGTPAPGSVWP